MKTFEWLKILNSPFMRPRVNVYAGKIALGTPYMLPRRWVKPSQQMAVDAARQRIADTERHNERNAKYGHPLKVRDLDSLTEEMKRSRFSVPKRLGFDFVGLGYKTKWSNTDYRFEWCPIWSFVIWKWQFALTFSGPNNQCNSNYWEAWLYYRTHTKGTIEERIAQCKKDFPQTYKIHSKNQVTHVDYYDFIFKDKYQ